MAHYVDGFVIPVPKKNIGAYRRMARKAGKLWREHGALEYRECAGDDLAVKMVMPFPKGISRGLNSQLRSRWRLSQGAVLRRNSVTWPACVSPDCV